MFRPNVAWTDGTNLSLIDEVAMIKWVTSESYISRTSLVTYVFYCTFQLTIIWRTIEKSLKKILRQLLLLRNHLKTLTMVSNNDEKYFSGVCNKARLVEFALLAAVYKFWIPKSKDWKSPTINIIIYIMKTMQRRIWVTAKKCSSVLTIPRTVVGQGRVYTSLQCWYRKQDVMSWTRNVSCYFFVFVKLPVVKISLSLMEISPNPSNYLPIMLLFIHRRYELNYRIFYDQRALRPQSSSAKSVHISYWQ